MALFPSLATEVERSTQLGVRDGVVAPGCRTCAPQSSPRAALRSQVVIRRRPLFYVVSLLLPSIFLMVMDIVGFYLPPDSGERVSFKITLLLGYSVFLIIVSDTLPATAIGTPLIGKVPPWGRARYSPGTEEWPPPPAVCVSPPSLPALNAQVSTSSCAWLCW